MGFIGIKFRKNYLENMSLISNKLDYINLKHLKYKLSIIFMGNRSNYSNFKK